MRTRILLAGACLLLSAVQVSAGDMWLGAGFDTTFTTVSQQSDWKSKPGFGGDLRFEWEILDQLSLQVQPGYVSRLVKGHVNASSSTSYVCIIIGIFQICGNMTTNYPAYDWERAYGTMDVPVLAKFKFLKKGFTPYVVAGPTLGLPLSGKYRRTEEGKSPQESDIKDTLSGVGFGIAAGLGLDAPIGDSVKLFVEGQYNLGLSSVYKSDSAIDGKFRTILVKVGVDFRLTKRKSS